MSFVLNTYLLQISYRFFILVLTWTNIDYVKIQNTVIRKAFQQIYRKAFLLGINAKDLSLSRHSIVVRFRIFKNADIQNNTLRIFQDYYLLNQFIYPAWIVLYSWFSWHRHSCNNFKLIYFTNDMKTLLLNIYF